MRARAATARRAGRASSSARSVAAHAARLSASRQRRPAGERDDPVGACRRARAGGRSASIVRPCLQAPRPPPTTIATLAGSRSAVGSSRITSGASRRNARASPIRRRSPRRQRPAAVADDRRVAVGQRRDELVSAGEPRGLAHRRRRWRPASPRRMLSATVPRNSVGCWGTQATSRRHASSWHSARSTSPTVIRRRSARAARAASAATVLLPAPLSPTSATVSPGESSSSSPSSTSPGRAGYENDTCSSRIGGPAGLGARQRTACRDRRGRVEQREHPLGHREPVRARVVLGAEAAERQVQLGREHEHGQAGLEREAAVDEPHAGRHRDQRDPERRRQLEHRAGQEADPQRLHRRRAGSAR